VIEQRRDPRVPLQILVDITTENGRKLQGQTENLSLGGAMLSLKVHPPLNAGEFLSVEFSIPRREEEALIVRRSGRVSWASDVLPDLLGICFETPLDEEQGSLLKGLIPEPVAAPD
jgi:hypothetical protein